MPGAVGERFDFFLSWRGSVAVVAQQVADVLTDSGYKVIVQDYDIPLGASFVAAMHEAVKNARDLIILFTGDYEARPTPARSSPASGRAASRRAGPSHRRPTLRRRAAPRPSGRHRLSGPWRSQRRRSARASRYGDEPQ